MALATLKLPKSGWWKQLGFHGFVERIGEWEQRLREHVDTITFTHDLLLPDDSSGGHERQAGAYFCGEAACVEMGPDNFFLAFFWTGRKDPEHAFYGFLPRSLVFFDKTMGEEDERSIARRARA